ncbi:growth-regulating factor 9 [Euphorbia peplus]|nr:growth-regulating factor 9 [Euphorbia peplus]
MDLEAQAEVKPLQTPAAPGYGPWKKCKVEEELESPAMKLGIGIGAGNVVPTVVKREKFHLTETQMDEFQRQVLVYKYISAGLPVPSALVRQIWKSVDDSLSFVNGGNGIGRRYSSFAGFSKEFDNTCMKDPETDGCRRTDGKKWRCRKDVVPGEKYCERHMHRGRRRSRKPVEFFQSITTSNATLTSKDLDTSNTDSFHSVSATPIDTSIHLKKSGFTSSNDVDVKIMGTNMTHSVVTCTKNMIRKGTLGLINAAAIMNTRTIHTDSTVTTAVIEGDKGGHNNYYKSSSIDDRNMNCGKHVGFKNQIDRDNNGCRNITNANVRLNFSPKSILQVVECSKEFDYTSMKDQEPDGCRRTDGKKWRCRKDVVPGQKYCEKHVNRGRFRSRKPEESFQTITAPTSKNLENSNTKSFYSASATIPSYTSTYNKNSGVTSSSNVDFKIMGTNMTPNVASFSTSMTSEGTLGNAATIMNTRTVHVDSTVTIATVEANKGGNKNYYKSRSIENMNGNCGKYVDRGNGYKNTTNANIGTSQRLNFSPKSVLQVQGSNPGCLQTSGGELEPMRCRRTDGKKWRCRRDVVPDEKYCKIHMHRGAKKRMLPYESPALPRATSSQPTLITVLPRNADTSNLNTNLSISINANTSGDGDTTISSSSSDTISDDIIANCDYRDVSS